ncbi:MULTISPECIES: O-antigen polymerase [Pectobacterium]|nr:MULTISPECIES: O-antigen polymerase [Pectobacterium]MBE5202630.1 oligosaccharide repeat unit polymerase [Pectobacterium quasiaquaticum]MBE5211086.1 oligosaccharide repeat unit polymerase [Pectobacterium quasiaquaticum]MBE5222864.1 oligosaccharide repeat unit polymerase [Pectobacterium quasiaquaticum]
MNVYERSIERSIIIKPALIFSLTWLLTAALYSFKFSELLIYPSYKAFNIAFFISGSFWFGCLLSNVIFLNLKGGRVHFLTEERVFRIDKKIRILFKIWIVITVVEVIYSEGVPIIWLFIGSSKTYADFGIPTLHGFINSLLLSISLISFYLYQFTKDKKYLFLPFFVCTWSVVAVTRNMLIVNVFQMLVLFIFYNKIAVKRVIKIASLFIVLILLFGIVGDFRTGKSTFFELAAVSSNYPLWLPSGFLWVYMYLATPINNLLNAINYENPIWSIGFENSTTMLIPSVLREVIYSNSQYTYFSNLITQAFNVSTAFLDPYRDMGYYGVFFISFMAGFLTKLSSKGKGIVSVLSFAVLTQCNILSVFFNHYMYLPIIFQIPLLFIILKVRLRKSYN